jgi:hypothetical protein
MKKTSYVAIAVIVLLFVGVLPVQAHGPYWRGGVWVGPGWTPWWGPRAYLGGPYWGAPYPYYAGPPVVVQQSPPVYVQQSPPVYVQQTPQTEEPYYWYYCQKPKGYYPYIKECPAGWMKVVPSPAPSNRQE